MGHPGPLIGCDPRAPYLSLSVPRIHTPHSGATQIHGSSSHRAYMLRHKLLRTLAAAGILLAGEPPLLSAQHVDDPVVPRGEWYFQLEPSSQLLHGLHDPDQPGSVRLGRGFILPEIGVDQAPELAPSEARFQSLAQEGSGSRIRLGATRGRFSGDEQVVPIRLSYGVLERLTLGVTVPFVRRRVDTLLRYVPEEANVGRNPARNDQESVEAFLIGAFTALDQLHSVVNERCADIGEDDPGCLEGRSLIDDAGGFLETLESAYEVEALFPLDGSDLGGGVADRWSSLREGLAGWDAEGPESLPLASDPLDQATFETLVVDPAWLGSEFPLQTPPAFLELGDVELHLALRVLSLGEAMDEVRLASSIQGTVRLPTGPADSLRAVAPRDPPRGVPGVELRWISDLLLPHRLAILSTVEAGWHGTREMFLVAPDPSRVFFPQHTRAAVQWQPGTHIRLGVTPRFRIGPGLSLGAGWHMVRRGADEFTAVHDDGPRPPSPEESSLVHRLSMELRYTAFRPPISESVNRPFELLARGSRSISGSGDWAPADRRIEIGARILVHR